MLHRFIDVAVGDDLHYFAVFDRREHIDRLQRDILRIQHAARHMVIPEADAVFQMRKNLIQQTAVHHLTGFGDDFARNRIDQRLGEALVEQTVFDVQLFIDFVTADIGQIVTFRVKEARHEQALRVFKRRRLARTKTFIDFDQRFFRRIRIVFVKGVADIFVVAQQIQNFGIRAEAKRTKQHGDRDFAGTVDPHVNNILRIRLRNRARLRGSE